MNFGYKIIAVDFDGTLCEDKWPEIGDARESLIWHLRCRRAVGDKIILWTCRVGERLQEAVEWCSERGLIFDAVNENLPEVIEACGGDSRKIYADEYIDDKMVGPFAGLRGMRAHCHMVDEAMDVSALMPMACAMEVNDYMKMRVLGEIDEMHEVPFKFDPAYVVKPDGSIKMTEVSLVAAEDGNDEGIGGYENENSV